MPSCVGHLYRFATRTDPTDADTRTTVAEAVRKAALMRESALKSSVFVGVPRVRTLHPPRSGVPGADLADIVPHHQSILTLGALHEALEEDVKRDLRSHSLR